MKQPTRVSLLVAGLFPALAIVFTAHHFDSNPWVWSWIIVFEIMMTLLLAMALGILNYNIAWAFYLRPARVREQELIAQLKDAEIREEQALQLAGTDPLTGLPNRRGVSLMLQKMFGAQRRFAHQDSNEDSKPKAAMQLAVAVIDLDGFKAANDQRGHDFGDTVLRLAAEILRRHFARDTDIVCRSGGDEFQVFMLGEQNDSACEAVTSRLETFGRLFESEFQRLFGSTNEASLPLSVTASCGVTIGNLPDDQAIDETLLAELLSSADRMMYQAKQGGKNQVVASQAD